METFNYSISGKKHLNEDERTTLVKLYQPIIGAQATSIYFTLLEESDVLTKLHDLVFNEKRLMKLLKLTNSKLMEGIYKLEGIKLLKRSYKKRQDLVQFQLLAPVDPTTFFDNILLNDMLKKALGEEDYEVVRFCYFDEETIDDDAEDLTMSFIDAFPEETNEITLKNLEFEELRLKGRQKLQPELIDFSNLELELIKHDLPTSLLTKPVKKLLVDNATFFNLNQEMLVEALIKAFDYQTQLLDKNLLKLYLKTELTQRNLLNNVTQVEQLKNEFKQIEPNEYVESLTGKPCSRILEELLITLKTKYHLAKENINCLLNYSVLKNNGKIVDRYILKIAQTLNKKQITGLDEVMDHLKSAHLYTLNKTEVEQLNDDERFANINNDLGVELNDLVELPEPNKYFII